VLFAKPLEQSTVVEQLQVARHPWLALAEDLGEFGDRELAARKHGEQTQTRRLCD
jgi:hypothetical protein